MKAVWFAEARGRPAMSTHASHTDEVRPLVDLTRTTNPILRALVRVAGSWVNRALYVDAVNKVHHDVATSATPDTFFRRTLEVLGCRYEVSESDLARIPTSGPLMVVANHPFGGLDGIILGDLLRRRRQDVKLMANSLLRGIRFASDHMFFVDPFASSKPATHNVAPLRESMKHLKSGGLLATFPGNKVSHFQWSRREVADAPWVPHIAGIIRRTGASAVPIFIEGGNSPLFNILGMIHPLLRTALLPREFVRRGRSSDPVRVHVGTLIPSTRLKRFSDDEEMIGFLRVNTYFLGNRPKNVADARVRTFAEKQKRAEPIAKPLPPEKLQADILALPPDACLLRQGDTEVYIATHAQLPHVMQEIGRGREVSFRSAGGGALKALDLVPQDEYYHHLFIWNKKDRIIVGAYRLGLADQIIPRLGHRGLICSSLFEFKPDFVKTLNPGMELGRSYILPEYQKNYSSLLLLWAGILTFIARNPKYNIIFGSVGLTQGATYAPASRTLIVNFMREQHGNAGLSVQIEPEVPFKGVSLSGLTSREISSLVHDIEDVSTLVTGLETDGRGVPILFKHYVRMNAKLLDFGVWTSHGDAVVGFMIADLTTADPKFLRRYMGAEGYQNFQRHHGLVTDPVDA
jgi:putative hemolysin